MLKFIRKYQLIMLAIGGSLLMVVFLIGPIFQQIGPSLANRTVATLRGGSVKLTSMDRMRATQEVQTLTQVFPFMFGNTEEGTRGLINLEDKGDHWLLLTHEADRAGLIGEAQDGRIWVDQELASVYAVTEKQYELYKQIPYAPFVQQQMQQPSVQAEIAERATELKTVIPSRVHQAAMSRGVDDAVIYRMLARARGVLRMIGRHDRAIRQSEEDVVEAIREVFDSAVTDFVLVPASQIVDESEAPADEKLIEQFERYKDEQPGAGDLGFGYTMPPRVQLGWLTLDHDAIAKVVTPDRIAVRKRWAENRDKYPGEFDAEREGIRAEIVDEQVNDLMIEADRVIVGRLRTALRGVPKEGAYYDIPADWGGETMETLAQAVVDELKAQRDIDFPVPGITYRVEKWFTEQDLADLEGIGQAYWRVGPDRVPVSSTPSLARDLGGSAAVSIQKRIPVIDPEHARDDRGNWYYVVLFGTREQSPPDSWEEIRDQLAEDVRLREAYESLTGRLDELKAMAADGEEGLEAVAARFNPPPAEDDNADAAGADEPDPISVSRWAVVSRNQVRRLDPSKPVDARANTAAFREAIIERARTLDPMTPFGQLPAEESVVGVELPAQHAIAVARILAYRPATTETRYALGARDIATLATREYSETDSDEAYPFTLEALKRRLDYQSRGDEDEEF
jgi:hypothetical protein